MTYTCHNQHDIYCYSQITFYFTMFIHLFIDFLPPIENQQTEYLKINLQIEIFFMFLEKGEKSVFIILI